MAKQRDQAAWHRAQQRGGAGKGILVYLTAGELAHLFRDQAPAAIDYKTVAFGRRTVIIELKERKG